MRFVVAQENRSLKCRGKRKNREVIAGQRGRKSKLDFALYEYTIIIIRTINMF